MFYVVLCVVLLLCFGVVSLLCAVCVVFSGVVLCLIAVVLCVHCKGVVCSVVCVSLSL